MRGYTNLTVEVRTATYRDMNKTGCVSVRAVCELRWMHIFLSAPRAARAPLELIHGQASYSGSLMLNHQHPDWSTSLERIPHI